MFVRERQERGMCSTAECLWRGVNSSDKWHGLSLLWGGSLSSTDTSCDECKRSGFVLLKLRCLFCPNRTHTHIVSGEILCMGPYSVRPSSDHSIAQIPACNYTGSPDSACIWQYGADYPQKLLFLPHNHTLGTHHRVARTGKNGDRSSIQCTWKQKKHSGRVFSVFACAPTRGGT